MAQGLNNGSMMTQSKILQALNQGAHLGNTHQRLKLEKCQALDPPRTTNKRASVIKTSLIPPTITHSN